MHLNAMAASTLKKKMQWQRVSEAEVGIIKGRMQKHEREKVSGLRSYAKFSSLAHMLFSVLFFIWDPIPAQFFSRLKRFVRTVVIAFHEDDI